MRSCYNERLLHYAIKEKCLSFIWYGLVFTFVNISCYINALFQIRLILALKCYFSSNKYLVFLYFIKVVMTSAYNIELKLELTQCSHIMQLVCQKETLSVMVQIYCTVVMNCSDFCSSYWCSSWMCIVTGLYANSVVLHNAIPVWFTSLLSASYCGVQMISNFLLLFW